MKYKISVFIVWIILFLCFIFYFFPSLKMKNSENRTLATFDMVFHPNTDSVVYHDSPVERLEAALSDQFPFREYVIKKYINLLNVSNDFTYMIANIFLNNQNNQHILHALGNYQLIDDTGYITTLPSTAPMDSTILQKRVDQIEYIHNNYKELKMYVYYVTQAYDTSWFNTYMGSNAANHYKEIVDAIPNYVKSDHLVYRDLNDYMNIHYKTDHHWNHRGANRGYENIYSMMSKDFYLSEMLVPLSEKNVSKIYDFVYLGSYGRSLGNLYNEGYDDFSFYEYNLPKREFSIIDPKTLKEKEVSKIGLYDEYLKGNINKSIETDHYITMYGTARDIDGNMYSDSIYPFVIRNSEGNGKNLIITGDSYGRAIRDALSSHFDTTIYLDYRTLSTVPIDYIIEKYDVDVLLINSNTSMWNSESYLFTFKDGDE